MGAYATKSDQASQQVGSAREAAQSSAKPQGGELADARPEAAVQRQLEETANRRPEVQRVAALQAMMDGSAHAQRGANPAPVQRTLFAGGNESDATKILLEAQEHDGYDVWKMASELGSWEDITSAIDITRNLNSTLDVTLDGNAITGSPFATLSAAVVALRPLIFTTLADDESANRYEVVAATSGNIRKLSGEKPFEAYSDGKSVDDAVEEAIAGLDLTGSKSFAYSRHDFQPSGSTAYNLQVQLGGSKGKYRAGKGDTSSTLVVVENALWDKEKLISAARWTKVIQAAHRQSFANTERVELKSVKEKKKE